MKSNSRNITWLASYPKSGNTWFRVFLSNLLSLEIQPVSINSLMDTPIASSRYLFDYYTGISSAELKRYEIEYLLPKVFQQISAESVDNVYIKVHDAWRKNLRMDPIFPARYTKAVVYIVRNPLDIAVSLSNHFSKPVEKCIADINDTKFELCAKNFKLHTQLYQYVSSWSNHVDSWLFQSKLPIQIVKFEDMINKPYDTFSNIVSFLDLKYSKAEILDAIKLSSFEELKKQEESKGFKEKPIGSKYFFNRGEVGYWKEILTENQSNVIIDSNRLMMNALGYL